MRRVLAPLGGAISFAVVVLLVIGGLTWVTIESLHVESEQRLAIARADAAQTERLALWQLDSRLFPAWGVENNRSYAHYFTFYTAYPVVVADGANGEPTGVPSALLTTKMPEWMKLHFQLDPDTGWDSPQVMGTDIEPKLREATIELFDQIPDEVTEPRRLALAELQANFPVKAIHEALLKLEKMNPADSPLAVPLPYQIEPEKVLAPPQAMPGGGGGDSLGGAGPQRCPSPADPNGPDDQARNRFALAGLCGGAGLAMIETPVVSNGRNNFYATPPAMPSEPATPANSVEPTPGGRGETAGSQQNNGTGYNAREAVGRKANDEMRSARGGTVPPAQVPVPDAAKKAAESLPAAKDDARNFDPKKIEEKEAVSEPPPQPLAPPLVLKTAADGKGPAGDAAQKERELPKQEISGKPAAAQLRDAEQDKGDAALGRREAAKANRAKTDAKPEQKQAVPKKTTMPNVRPPIVQLGPMRPVWIRGVNGQAALVLVRAARLENKLVFQGVLLDWPKLRTVLTEEISTQLPQAKLEPVYEVHEPNERRMTALPAVLDPVSEPVPPPAGWTPLRIGLTLGWIAALFALAAVGIVGWTLIDLSERRIRFVSAVTHELRTPLTSLRLYTDLLASGMISDEEKQKEYLRTIGGESERLNTLVENVLDFAKLEKRTVRAHCVPLPVGSIIEQVSLAWSDRLANESRELVMISTLAPDSTVTTDVRIASQILGNLIDNARKYSQNAEEKRIWLWAKPGEKCRVILEVEDRGPGVPASECHAIFKPFRRGQNVSATGGAGLGLALARQWTDLLGGTLAYRPADGGVGACFRLELPG